MVTPRRFHLKLAAAWIRGRAAQGAAVALPPDLREPPLESLDAGELSAIVACGEAAGLPIDAFSLGEEPLVVLRVRQWLRRIPAGSLLDVGSGPLLWPFLESIPGMRVAALPRCAEEAGRLEALVLGGWRALEVVSIDAARFPAGAFDAVLALDGLEGVVPAEEAVLDLVGWARRAVFVATANREPAWPEPQPVDLYGRSGLTALFTAAGASRVTIDVVGDRLLAVAWLGTPLDDRLP